VGRVIRDQILRPLRLTNTSYQTGLTLPKPFAHGYFGGLDLTDPLTDDTRINPAAGAAAGAMQSTLGDVRKWAKALATGRLLSRSLQAQRLQTVPFPNPGSPVTIGGLAGCGRRGPQGRRRDAQVCRSAARRTGCGRRRRR
jgi:D-alanyl-D-alanine carboxypeptidase